MTLTLGNSPFGKGKNGKFNFELNRPEFVIYWEDFPKHIRVEFNGEIIADSQKIKSLHETGQLMVLYFPREDVNMGKLEPAEHRTKCPHKGTASYWCVKAGGKSAENAAWSYENPVESVAFIKDYIGFVYHKMDAWYQEAEKIYAHPRDPYHRYDIHPSSRHVIVHKNGKKIAESKNPILLFETGLPIRYYLPPEDVNQNLLQKSDLSTPCPYKGGGQHWHLKIDDEMFKNIAWSLPKPIGEAVCIKDYFCFYPQKAELKIDGKTIEG